MRATTAVAADQVAVSRTRRTLQFQELSIFQWAQAVPRAQATLTTARTVLRHHLAQFLLAAEMVAVQTQTGALVVHQ